MDKIDIINFKEYFYYDETSPSCLRWKVDVLTKSGRGTRAKKDRVAGCKRKDGYFDVRLKGINYLVHRIIYSLFNEVLPQFIDHLDGNTSNNKLSNLREVSHQTNCKNRIMRNDNTSGKTGVSFHMNRNGRKYWVTKWVENKSIKAKYFSIEKFGNEEAFKLACNHRDVMVELDKKYTERHGK